MLGEIGKPDEQGLLMTYWIVCLALIIFGFLTGFSIGQPFLLVGLTLLVLRPFRKRPLIFIPTLAAVIAYNLGYWAVAPITCVAGSATSGASTTVCSSLIGLRYSGEGIYNPSLLPAVGVGLLAAGLTALVAVVLLRRKLRASPGDSPS